MPKSLLSLLFLKLLIVTSAFAQQSQTELKYKPWKTDIDLGGFAPTTYLTVTEKENKILLESPKNADIRVIGGTKSMLGRLMGKLPAKGKFLVIEGEKVNDSIIGNAKMLVLGNVEFRGKISEENNSLAGSFIRAGKTIATLQGQKTADTRNDYTSFYPKIQNLAYENLYSREVLKTAEWKEVDKKLKALTSKAVDDVELYLGFSMIKSGAPFSHFYLVFQEVEETETEAKTTAADTVKAEPTVVFEEKSPKIAYLKIKDFSSSQKEIADVFPKIIDKGYENLIVDLRNNGGGGVEAAMEFASHILRDSVFVGYFITNKFPDQARTKAALDKLPASAATTTEGLIEELKTSPGARLIAPKPKGPIFTGKIYVLTNKNTGSTCEPIVYVLKNKNLATIIGETTAGAMLSATFFTIQGKYKLVLPVADFLTYDLNRIEKQGVKPDIETTSDAALDRAISEIGK